ncbi:hypothetical protein ACFV2Q_35105 [Streptomyces sp. NPDC059650]|uniref:hypothetical protein n=1 Tax=Streptomyces sp. NPDC059650 TaxID=3346896 RepID=UPI003681DF04
MSDGYDELDDTLRVIEQLLSQTGLNRDSALSTKELSFDTSLSVEDLQTLLKGERLPIPSSFDREVVRRIAFLKETRLNTSQGESGVERRTPYSNAQIARECGMTGAWLSSLLQKGKAPNLDHTTKLAAFFNVPVAFLTDPPAKALARVLKEKVIPHLQHFTVNPTQATMNRHAVGIATRLGDTDMTAAEEQALMVFVDAIVASRG